MSKNAYKREILGLFFVIVGLFILLALAGYSPTDPGFGRAGAGYVHNFAGLWGAYVAAFLFDLAGLAAWLFPLAFIGAGVGLLRNQFCLWRLIVTTTCFLCSLSFLTVLLGLQGRLAGRYPVDGGVLAQLGRDLLPYTGQWGFFLIIVFLQVLGLSLLSGLTPSALFSRIKELFYVLYGKWRSGVGSKKGAPEPQVYTTTKVSEDDSPPLEQPIDLPHDNEAGLSTPQVKQRADKDFEITNLPVTQGRGFELPPLKLLNDPPPHKTGEDREKLLARARLLEEKLANFGIKGRVVEVCPGPVITVYEYEPAPGVKISRITALADDLALGLKAASVRIVGPLPGKSAVGIEVANNQREIVYLKEILASEPFRRAPSRLTMALGKDISGRPVVADLTKMPHLLIAGATGTGKSVCLHAMIMSLLFKATPKEVRLLLVDPKRIELSVYEGIPHLLHPVVLEPKMATRALKWAVVEMERRYHLLEEAKARNLESYNQIAAEKLPYIVIVVDELADLMVVSSKDVETSLTRLSQMARASGIHLLLATQRPSVDVLTGIIKANFPARISFQVSSKTDSRTILDTGGAERLLGAGDMLFLPPGTSKLKRIHGAFISEAEVRRVIEFLKVQGEPVYEESLLTPSDAETTDPLDDEEVDELYQEAVNLVIKTGQASISMLQRRLRVGYNRAARMIERMEREGIVGPSDGVRPRPVLVRPEH